MYTGEEQLANTEKGSSESVAVAIKIAPRSILCCHAHATPPDKATI